MSDSSPPHVAHSGIRKNKRPRAIQACEFCRAKKYKCAGTWPCQHCEKYKVECVFEASESNAAGLYAASYVKSLEERIERLNAAAALTQFSPPSTATAASSRGEEYHSSLRTHAQPVATYENSGNGSSDAQGRHSESSDEAGAEIADVNRHTQGIEFHGSTSSVAFLGSVQQRVLGGLSDEPAESPQTTSLVNALHNPGFSPQDGLNQGNDPGTSSDLDGAFFSPRASVFLDAYFSNLHFIHPMIDREMVYKKSEELWRSSPDLHSSNFINLYLSLIALGALIRTWNEETVMGMHRFDWSRKAFRKAAASLQKGGTRNDIETIQFCFIMAKVCQNELNPSLAYIYLGLAIRLSLSAGINREPRRLGKHTSSQQKATIASRTWWGIYSLEIELSFSLGRPDTLGYDMYHNVSRPPVDESETAIIPVMVDFGKIIRNVSLEIYLSHRPAQDKLARAFQIEDEMISWLNRLPPKIRPRLPGRENRNNALRDPVFAKLQRLVLQIRFYNVTMLLMRPFLIYSSQQDRPSIENLNVAVTKCITAAAQTIELIHETYVSQTYFRTWWYNTTYVLFAASIVLFALTQPAIEHYPLQSLNELIERSIDVLEAMTECVVAQKAAEMIKTTLAQVRSGLHSQAPIEIIAMSLPVSPRMAAETGTFEFTDDFGLLMGSGEFDSTYDSLAYGAQSNGMFWPNLHNSFDQT